MFCFWWYCTTEVWFISVVILELVMGINCMAWYWKLDKFCFFSLHTGPTKRNHIKEGLLWWDLNKKQVEIPSERRVSDLTYLSLLVVFIVTHLQNICRPTPCKRSGGDEFDISSAFILCWDVTLWNRFKCLFVVCMFSPWTFPGVFLVLAHTDSRLGFVLKCYMSILQIVQKKPLLTKTLSYNAVHIHF